ncbi:ATP synthase [Dacryopinax primogenitus]|uniref:ATP synthase subunit 4 n=1 Tax=Dacryopinax primogenitus (strain DJM 731) TaxID=1858805 RepID=M5GCB6_DACPD|nr:ATP synthase [Dacryopinax primogenitus]EJU03782.1 ATP synthase [Dacryopinax primogenitus]
MASRLLTKSLRASASLARPQVAAALPRVAVSQSMRGYVEKQPPAERASAIIDALPGNSLITKTGSVVLGTGLAAAAISQELYVVNEETVVAVGFLILLTALGRGMSGPYGEWAKAEVAKIAGILNDARKHHTSAVQERIDAVNEMQDVVAITKDLFALSKDTAKLEGEAYVLKQKTAVAAEVKAVLDSWVRFEQQAKENEQAELARSVIEKVMADIQSEKTQREILMSAVAEVEQLVKSKAI